MSVIIDMSPINSWVTLGISLVIFIFLYILLIRPLKKKQNKELED
jgi:preprotein translocase subunit YajC